MKDHRFLTTRELTIDALLSALLFISQVSLSWLPNVELISILLILYTLVFRKHVWLILYVFVMLEGLLYGFGLWWFSYLYIWAILPAMIFILFKNRIPGFFEISLLSGIFGMLFGLFCSITYLITGGFGAALTWWAAGIPFDITHGISNFLLSMILFKPLYHLLNRLKQTQP